MCFDKYSYKKIIYTNENIAYEIIKQIFLFLFKSPQTLIYDKIAWSIIQHH